jgi:hypothetical protein
MSLVFHGWLLGCFRHEGGNYQTPQSAIYAEVGIQRPYARLVVEFGEADKAGIREGHRLIAVTAHELAQRGQFCFDGEGDSDHAAFDQREQRVGFAAMAAQEMRGLREHRFASEQGRAERSHRFAGPTMMLRLPDEKGNERSGVGDDDFAHWPKSSRYLGFVAMSRGPLRQPARSRARSRHDAA